MLTHPVIDPIARAYPLDLASAVVFLACFALVAVSIGAFARGPYDDPYVLGALGASVGFALHQAGDLLVYYPKVGELWWILLALAAARRDARRARAPA
ncbi:MAG: hypothetical protein NVSMB21_24360 [Vulcanimicrobiaceae bacterium]